MRVCFLDIDGVLNSTRSLVAIGVGYPGKMERQDDPKLDPIAVSLLMKAHVEFGFKIVLSSTWRIGYSTEELIEMWQDSMLRYYGWNDFPIIGATSWVHDRPRGEEINLWLDEHPEVEDFIIVDDDGDMHPDHISNGHFHRTNPDIGLDTEFMNFCYEHYGSESPRIIGV